MLKVLILNFPHKKGHRTTAWTPYNIPDEKWS